MTEDSERRELPRRQQDAHNDAMAQNIAALAALVEAATLNVQALTGEVHGLRKAIVPRKAIEGEARRLARERRRGVAALAVFAVALMWMGDEHVEHCGPGTRAETAVRALVESDPGDPNVRDNIIDAVNGDGTPKFCDMSFPLHDHDGNGWPHKFNLIGMSLWGAGIAGAVYYTRDSWRPRRRLSDDEEVPRPTVSS